MSTRGGFVFQSLLFVVVLCAIPTLTLSCYKVTDLGTLGGEHIWPRDINDAGVVVGGSETAQTDQAGAHYRHAFLWQKGKMTDLAESTTEARLSARMLLLATMHIPSYGKRER